MFKRAIKAKSYLRLALAGPSGAGKTYTALALATVLAGDKPVAVIDTERGSASLYSDLFQFDVLELDSFHPDRYIEAIQAAQAAGYGALVIDSLTHAWEGKGGLLEIVEAIAKRSYGGNTFRAWAEGTPIQNRLIDTITGARLHVIATMRTKTDYATDKDERSGKMTPHKVGLAVKQRDGIEYEFDIFGKMTVENELIIEKSRCPDLAGQAIRKPGREMAETLIHWLNSGEDAPQLRVVQPAPVSGPVSGPVVEERAVVRPTTSAWKALKDPDITLLLQQMGKISDPERVACVGLIKRELDEQGIPWNHENVLAALREEAVKQHDLHELGSEGRH